MQVEICANSYRSAKAAQEGGAHRIELCTQLAVGGLTPSRQELEKVVLELTIPVHVLIRPRKGDFHYSEEEILGMIKDIEHCKSIGCAGIVSGVLTKNLDVHRPHTQRLMEAAKGMAFTFHRAFDEVRSPNDAIGALKELKVDRLLSSGQQPTAIEGLSLLIALNDRIDGKFELMPGSGINSMNVMAFKDAGFQSVHLSATSNEKKETKNNSLFNTGSEGTSNRELIERIVSQLA